MSKASSDLFSFQISRMQNPWFANRVKMAKVQMCMKEQMYAGAKA